MAHPTSLHGAASPPAPCSPQRSQENVCITVCGRRQAKPVLHGAALAGPIALAMADHLPVTLSSATLSAPGQAPAPVVLPGLRAATPAEVANALPRWRESAPDLPDEAIRLAEEKTDIELPWAAMPTGAAVHAVDRDGWTALMSAAAHKQGDALNLLLEAGARVDASGCDGTTALMLAAENGCDETLRLLLDADASVNQVAEDGRTALMAAASHCHVAAMSALLAAGARIEQARPDGYAALSLAALNGHADMVERLLQWGAKARSAEGALALRVAESGGYTAAAAALRRALT